MAPALHDATRVVIGSSIEGSSFSGLLTRVEIAKCASIPMGMAGRGREGRFRHQADAHNRPSQWISS
jgi:hypothetical protein